jgi:amidase
VLPVLHGLPPRRDATDDDLRAFRSACLRLTVPASLAGAPELVLPVRHERSGHTFGVGLVGAPGADRSLLEVAVRLGAAGALDV